MKENGKVYLVGAGIGSEENITIKGKKVLEQADVIVYDRLLNMGLINLNDTSKEFIYAGKESANHYLTQDETNEIMVKKALEGKTVARLKGGDPYVFGRGGEEAEYLVERGIEFEVVPGITSGIAGLCFSGIPITHRDYSSSLHLITGHKKTQDYLDFYALSKLNGTVVFYMGLENLSNIVSGFMKNEKSPDTPCAVISHGGYPDQVVVASSLENILKDIEGKNIKSPSLIVIGDVVKLRSRLNFFENKSLFGKNIVVTRARAQASSLVSALKDHGANVIEVPAIEIKQINIELLSKEINNLQKYSHIIFTSTNAVKIFMDNLLKIKDVRSLGNIKIFAIGDGTAAKLMEYGIKADFVPSSFVAETLFEEIKDFLKHSDKILMPRALKSRSFLKDKLSEICETVEVFIYDTIIGTIGEYEKEILKNKIDYITFTSSSTVENFIKLIDSETLENIRNARIISIGPITTKTAENNGLNVYKQSEIYNIENLINTILNDLEK